MGENFFKKKKRKGDKLLIAFEFLRVRETHTTGHKTAKLEDDDFISYLNMN